MPAKIQTIAELKKELCARERSLGQLQVRRAKAAKKLAAIDRMIAAIGGETCSASCEAAKTVQPVKTTHVRRRAKGESLVAYIEKVLAKAANGMRALDVASAVKKAGYKTISRDFYGIVAATLRNPKFKRVKRGVYKLA